MTPQTAARRDGAHHSSLHSATPTPARQVPRATPRSHPRLTRGGPPCSLARPAVRARTGARPRYAPMLLVLPDRALVSVASPRASTPLKGVRRTPEGCSPSKGALRAPAARAGSRPSRRQAVDPAPHIPCVRAQCARDRFVAGSGIAKVHLLISVLVSRPPARVAYRLALPRPTSQHPPLYPPSAASGGTCTARLLCAAILAALEGKAQHLEVIGGAHAARPYPLVEIGLA